MLFNLNMFIKLVRSSKKICNMELLIILIYYREKDIIMKYISGTDFKLDNTCVAFGDFEALHKGHKIIIDKIEETGSGYEDLTTALLIFDYKEDLFDKSKFIYTQDEKKEMLEGKEIDVVISYPFTSEIATMEPETFIKEILVGKLGAKQIIVGSNYRFGKDCSGDVNTLEEMSEKYGYNIVICDVVEEDGEIISSARIREMLKNGEIRKANRLLGRPFKMIGKVVHGKALGRTVGMPTANLQVPENKLMPQYGVYATLSEIDGRRVQGLTNIGRRPSVDDHSYATIETFLLDFSKNIYGLSIELNVHEYIRGVEKFNSLDEVKKQVEKDISSIREYLDRVS